MTNGDMKNEINQGPSQSAPVENSKKTSPILIIVAIVAICCVVGGIAVFIGAITLPDFIEPDYRDEPIGNFVFKIPNDFVLNNNNERLSYEFKNGSTYLRIVPFDTQDTLHDFASDIWAVFEYSEYTKVNINGTTAYKFSTEDIDTGKSSYSYAIKLNGQNYVISVSRDIPPNPDDFIAKIIS